MSVMTRSQCAVVVFVVEEGGFLMLGAALMRKVPGNLQTLKSRPAVEESNF